MPIGNNNEAIGAFGKGFCQVIFNKNDLQARLRRGPERLNAQIDTVFQYFAPQIEADAKVNAPWEDQTGNARNGLAARAGGDGNEHFIALFHQVPYGIWLELKYSGRYAVIQPTLERWEPRVMAGLNGILGKDIFG